MNDVNDWIIAKEFCQKYKDLGKEERDERLEKEDFSDSIREKITGILSGLNKDLDFFEGDVLNKSQARNNLIHTNIDQ